MQFKDREQAANMLAAKLASYKKQNPLVLGVPRGAVPMSRIIASALGGELDVVLVRKLRVPFQPELAIGAVDGAGSVLKGRYSIWRKSPTTICAKKFALNWKFSAVGDSASADCCEAGGWCNFRRPVRQVHGLLFVANDRGGLGS